MARNTKLLIAEPSASVRGWFAEQLRHGGWTEIHEAGDLADAVRIAATEQPQAVMLQLPLPSAPGLDPLLQIVNAAPAARVVVLSANGTECFRRRCLQAGAHEYYERYSSLGLIRAAAALNALLGRLSR